MKRSQVFEEFVEASHQFAANMEAGNWEVAGYWAHVAFERYQQLVHHSEYMT